MARNYRPVDRDQPFLVPPDMRDWLSADHLVWFILEVVAELDTSALHAKSKRGGVGREGYDPDVLLGVLFYASTQGIRSSRQIERACSEDVAFRVLCAQDVPDYTVLAKFRQAHQDAMADLFAQVLALCVGRGLGRFGVIAIDGTKIKANASKEKMRTLKKLRELAAEELAAAAEIDAAEDAALVPAAGDDLPPGFEPGSDRRSRIRAAIKDLEDVVQDENKPHDDALEKRLVKAEAKLARLEANRALLQQKYDAAVALNRTPKNAPSPDTTRLQDARKGVVHARALLERSAAHAAKEAAGDTDRTRRTRRILQRNTTDPQARMMHTRDGYIMGYNAQLAVAEGQLIVAVTATDAPNDQEQLVPMMERVDAAIKHCQAVTERTDLVVGTVVFDNGYLSEENVNAPGYDRLIAPGRGAMKDGKWAGKVKGREGQKISDAAQIMLTKLALPGNQEIYNRRSPIVEPVNGHLKDRRRLRQFGRRGLAAVDAELNFDAMTTNLMKLFTQVWQPARIQT